MPDNQTAPQSPVDRPVHPATPETAPTSASVADRRAHGASQNKIDTRNQATELLARIEYVRITGLDTSTEHKPWAELCEGTRDAWRESFTRHADALLAAGWRPPARVITTAEEIAEIIHAAICYGSWEECRDEGGRCMRAAENVIEHLETNADA